jgi:four helix bundle protein
MSVKSYRDLIVWQKGMDLAVEVYRLTNTFPKKETYGLASQLGRCAVSIPSNIAEGQGRGATNEYLRFLRIARGSVQELETQLILTNRLGYTSEVMLKRVLPLAEEVSRLISGLARSLRDNGRK